MALAPADYDQSSLDATNHWLAVWKREREEILDENRGWVAWALGPPAKRRAGYLACTWPEDLILLMSYPDYYDLRKAQAVPELRAVLEYQKVTAPIPDGKGGQTIPVPPDMRPYAWARWVSCEKEVFDFFQKDAVKLIKSGMEQATA